MARKGSKRLINKNLLKINKKPLIELTINFVKKIAPRNNIIFSTDSRIMLNIANKLGINTPWLRPKKFSLDGSSSFDASLHAIKWFENKFFKIDAIALFQPTSPFRSKEHFIKALEKFKKNSNHLFSYLDLATTASGAKILILYKGVSGSSSVGNLRPMTRNSRNGPFAFIFT